MELMSTLFSTIFPATIISPALLILLESDINILPSLLMQPPAYQRARTFNICINENSIPINTYVDHYLISSMHNTNKTTLHNRQFYLFDVNAYSLIPI